MIEDPHPYEWEFAALPLIVVLLGALGIVLWAFTAGVWIWVALGVVILAVLIALSFAAMVRPRRRAGATAASPLRVADGVHRVLVVADAACSPSDLAPAIGSARPSEAFVVAPVIGSRVARWTGDERPYGEAATHLEAAVTALEELRVAAVGQIGPHDPLQAVDDGLREFPADEIVLVVHPEGKTNWLESGVVELAQSRYPIPVRACAAPPGAA